MSQEDIPPVLTAYVHDVRYFAALLRGVNFVNRATVTVTKRGLTVTVEEARTVLGTAFIFEGTFDEYIYHPGPSSPRSSQFSHDSEENDSEETTAFEVPLSTLLECINIFGTAGPSSSSSAPSSSGKFKKIRRNEEGVDVEGGDGNAEGGGRGLDAYWGQGGGEKKTGARMSYVGAGYPLTLLIAEDASGPMTTCEIATFDPEPQLELDFDSSRTVLKIILKSSWLREALSELDPSCEKLTFIGNPPGTTSSSRITTNTNPNGRQRRARPQNKPILRIQGTGTFGSTEMDYPNDRDVLETFECTQSVSFSYRFAHIARTLRALQSSAKTSLRIDEDGLLSLQFLMPSPRPKGAGVESVDAFIEFRCLALDDEL